MIMFFAVRSIWPFSVWTAIWLGAVAVAVPLKILILLAFTRPTKPLRKPTTMAFFRCWMLGQFGDADGISIPIREACFADNSVWAEAKSAFEGMQPLFRHVPPKWDFSIKATEIPFWAHLIAAEYPPGPLPITMTSKIWAITRYS